MSESTGALTRFDLDSEISESSMQSSPMWSVAARALRLLPPERAQRAVVSLLQADRSLSDWLTPDLAIPRSVLFREHANDPRLKIDVLGLAFPNPVGLAAGFDKDARVRDEVIDLGFGFVECGTVTPLPQAGMAGTRLFRLLEDEAVINRMGFNSDGLEKVAVRLSQRRHRGIVGINIGANRDSSDRIGDYVTLYHRLAKFVEYVTINVSSPNTPGLRGLQNKVELQELLSRVLIERELCGLKRPLLLKIAPDLDGNALDDIAAVVIQNKIDGIIISNTTTSRPPGLRSAYASELGGLSGAPLFDLSTHVLREVRRRVGNSVVLIGAGGVSSGCHAYKKIKAGASLVQLYTAFAYRGHDLIPRIKRELSALLARDGFAHVADAVGADAR